MDDREALRELQDYCVAQRMKCDTTEGGYAVGSAYQDVALKLKAILGDRDGAQGRRQEPR